MAKVDSDKSQSCTIDVHESSDNDGYYNMSSTRVAPVPDTEICSQPSTPERVEVEFEVQDTGIGISKEKLQDMFNPFTQADASTSRLYGGTGLGLCIVQRFVELLGGTIWAQSEVNKGSTFGFRVPLRMSAEAMFAMKPEVNQGSLRFGSLDAVVPLKRLPPKDGLTRRAYSLDVLTRNMKFTLPSLVEGNDGEESVSSKSSGNVDSRGSSLQRTTTEEAILTVLDSESVKPTTESSLEEYQPSTGDPEAKMAKLTIRTSHRKSDSCEGPPAYDRRTGHPPGGSSAGHSRSGSCEGKRPASHRRNASREGLPPSGPNDKLHKFEKSYVRSKSSEEKRPKANEFERPEFSSHTTVINHHRNEGEQPLLKNVSQPKVDDRSTPEQSSSSQQQPQANLAPLQSRLLPAADVISAKGSKKPSLEDGAQSLHILLAEDNPINQKVATRQLERHGHRVTIVNDGKLALEAVQAKHEAYDLVLMDVQMPNMDGLQATEAIRDMETQRNWSRLPILGLTAHAIQGYQETCLSHGMDGYLGKPFEIKQLLRQMQELLSSNNRGPRDHG
jgi:CheY-like chemotaxis protein